MNTPLLNDPQIFPDLKVLKDTLGKSFDAYTKLLEKISVLNEPFVAEWRYYNDGKAWLCKFQNKKKNIFWLSVWQNYFMGVFYFSQKTKSGIFNLALGDNIKTDFEKAKPIGKLIPLILVIENEDQIQDLLTIADYKNKIK